MHTKRNPHRYMTLKLLKTKNKETMAPTKETGITYKVIAKIMPMAFSSCKVDDNKMPFE